MERQDRRTAMDAEIPDIMAQEFRRAFPLLCHGMCDSFLHAVRTQGLQGIHVIFP